MLFKKSEFQRSMRAMDPSKTHNEKLIDALKGIELNTRFIIYLLAFLAFLVVLFNFSFVEKADKIIELFN